MSVNQTSYVDKENTTIVDGGGDKTEIQNRIESIKAQIETSNLILIKKNCKNV